MGKVRTRILGLEEVEKKQKEESKQKAQGKKSETKQSGLRHSALDAESRIGSRIGVRDDKEIATSPEAPRDDKKQAKKEPKQALQKKRIRGKRYTQAAKKRDKTVQYPLDEALGILKKIRFAGFDESVELHINTDVAGLRGEVELPHATGKTIRVAIVNDEVLKEIEKGIMNFDVLITHPSYMPKLARFAKVLGPRGLMPNPKAGTISDKPEVFAQKFTKGMLRWKTEPKFPLIHQMIGKISTDEKDLGENARVLLRSVGKHHIAKVFIKTTMSPSLRLNIEQL